MLDGERDEVNYRADGAVIEPGTRRQAQYLRGQALALRKADIADLAVDVGRHAMTAWKKVAPREHVIRQQHRLQIIARHAGGRLVDLHHHVLIVMTLALV